MTIEPKPKGTIRIVTVGDSTTMGIGAQFSTLQFSYDHHTVFDGSKSAYWGYPFLLFQLLHNHNSTAKFQVINFGADNFTLLE